MNASMLEQANVMQIANRCDLFIVLFYAEEI